MTWKIDQNFMEEKTSHDLSEEPQINFAVSYPVMPNIPAMVANPYCNCISPMDMPMPMHLQFYNDARNIPSDISYCINYDSKPELHQNPAPDTPMPASATCEGIAAYDAGFSPLIDADCCSRPYDTRQLMRRHPATPTLERETWSFEFPKALCGRLIGKKGHNIKSLIQETGTTVSFDDLKQDDLKTILKISGKKEQILNAMQMIKSKFDNVKLSKLGEYRVLPLIENETVKVLQLKLPPNSKTDIVVTSILDAGHIYLQMVDVTTKSLLETLRDEMNLCYGKPGIPGVGFSPVVGTYCVVKSNDTWFRCQVIQRFDETKQVEVVLVDYGAVSITPFSSLKKIRSDFLEIPFQAIECCLFNIVPKEDELLFSLDALKLLQKLTDGKILQAVCRDTNWDVPYVELFTKGEKVSLNRKLVQEGVVAWSTFFS